MLKVALDGLGIQTGVGYGKGWNDGMRSPAPQTTDSDNDDLNILVVLVIPGMANPAMHIFATRTRLKSELLNN